MKNKLSPEEARLLGTSSISQTNAGLIVPRDVIDRIVEEKLIQHAELMEKAVRTTDESAPKWMQNMILKSQAQLEALGFQFKQYPFSHRFMVDDQLANRPVTRLPSQYLKNIVHVVPIIGAIYSNRLNKLITVCEYRENPTLPGWTIRRKEAESAQDAPSKNLSKDKKRERIVNFFKCPHPNECKSFYEFLVKFFPNHFLMDRVPIERTFNAFGEMTGMVIGDGSYIYPFLPWLRKWLKDNFPENYKQNTIKEGLEKFQERYKNVPGISEKTKWVKVEDQYDIVAAFTAEELSIAVKHPSPFVGEYGLGCSAVEMAFSAIDHWRSAWVWNENYLTQGFGGEGILGIRGAYDDDAIATFETEMRARHSGARNAGTIAVMKLLETGDLTYIDMKKSPKDMQFLQGLHYATCIICAYHEIHPSEIYMQTFTTKENPLFEHSKKEEIELSTPGFNSLLTFIKIVLNQEVMPWLDPSGEWEFAWTGLEEQMDERDKINLRNADQTKSMDEKRAEQELPLIADLIKESDLETLEGRLKLSYVLPGGTPQGWFATLSAQEFYEKQGQGVNGETGAMVNNNLSGQEKQMMDNGGSPAKVPEEEEEGGNPEDELKGEKMPWEKEETRSLMGKAIKVTLLH